MQAGIEGKREGMAAALHGHTVWKVRALVIFQHTFASGELVTGEIVRMTLSNAGLEQPRHHSAWSALISSFATRRLIEDTGKWKLAGDPKSHGRRLPIWRVV